MVRNVLLMKLTEQGVKDIKEAPNRIERAIQGFEKMGGKLEGFYAITGEYDYLAVGEMPSEEAWLVFVMSLSALGNVKVMTCRAYSKEEFAAAIAKLP